jgi:hypothetical protein
MCISVPSGLNSRMSARFFSAGVVSESFTFATERKTCISARVTPHGFASAEHEVLHSSAKIQFYCID